MKHHYRKEMKESIFGSANQVKKIGNCYHDWEPLHHLIFGYMPVDAKCKLCGTYWSLGAMEK